MDNPVKEPQMTDIGTRLDHLTEFADSLFACIEYMKKRGIYTPIDLQRYAKLVVAEEVLRGTVNAYLGLSDPSAEYKIYQLLNPLKDIKPEQIEGGRGTPLKES